MRLRSASPSPRVCSAFECASATSTVTSRSALARISCELLAALGAEFGRLALALGLHALIDRLAVLLRQVGAPDPHVHHLDAEARASLVELIAHPRHQLGALVAHDMGRVASPSTRRSAELSRMESRELAPSIAPSV